MQYKTRENTDEGRVHSLTYKTISSKLFNNNNSNSKKKRAKEFGRERKKEVSKENVPNILITFHKSHGQRLKMGYVTRLLHRSIRSHLYLISGHSHGVYLTLTHSIGRTDWCHFSLSIFLCVCARLEWECEWIESIDECELFTKTKRHPQQATNESQREKQKRESQCVSMEWTNSDSFRELKQICVYCHWTRIILIYILATNVFAYCAAP